MLSDVEMTASAMLPEGVTRGRRNPLHHTLPDRLRKAREARGLSARALSLQAAALPAPAAPPAPVAPGADAPPRSPVS